MNGWINERNQWIIKRMNEWIKDWMNKWINDWMNQWMNEWPYECRNEWTNKWIKVDLCMKEWRNDWINGQTVGLLDWMFRLDTAYRDKRILLILLFSLLICVIAPLRSLTFSVVVYPWTCTTIRWNRHPRKWAL